MYILILVDRSTEPRPRLVEPRKLQTETTKVQIIEKGQQMVGLHYKGERPSLIIDEITDRTLMINGEDKFEEWWKQCVVPNAVKAEIKKRPSN